MFRPDLAIYALRRQCLVGQMALIKCPQCGHDVSPQAESCPSCGHPIAESINRRGGGSGCGIVFGIVLLLIGVFVILALFDNNSAQKKEGTVQTNEADASTCKVDWSKCKTNSDIANDYEEITSAQVACKFYASKLAKYGEPKWPWLSFSHFTPGDDAPRTGVLHLREPDAQFQNQFGAMAHVDVDCSYNLKDKKVLDAIFLP